MSPNPEAFLQHLQQLGYHPRSNKHSNALSEAIVDDLLSACPRMAEDARQGRLVYDLNFTLHAGTSDWNVDLVLGAPSLNSSPPQPGERIRKATPSTVYIAIEIKGVMTEHHKAVKNRKRDLEAHHEHVHRYNNAAIAAGVLVVNQAATFKSPLRPEVTAHREPKELVKHCIHEMRSVTTRPGLQGEGLEAKTVLVVDMDNQDLGATHFVNQPPAPTIGDPLHYDAFIQSIASLYVARFGQS
jgi:hypothetical protein